ncbi:MAG TPA: recombinase RecT [Cytophagaceae bacterium]
MEQNTQVQLTTKSLFAKDEVKQKFQELLGKRAPAFMTSVLQIISQSKELAKADPHSVYHAAAVAATLDLPINQNLGFAYIVAYFDKKQNKYIAQFQMGWKGFVQLAQRTGQFQSISVTHITDKDTIKGNRLSGYEFEFADKPGSVVGYAANFRLLNGFEKTLYMTNEELRAHGLRFSQTFKKGFGLWNDDFHSMASKTVLKQLLSKFAPLSVEMQQAVTLDQALIKNEKGDDYEYPDNEQETGAEEVDKEAERINLLLSDCKTVAEVEAIQKQAPEFPESLFDQRKNELSK